MNPHRQDRDADHDPARFVRSDLRPSLTRLLLEGVLEEKAAAAARLLAACTACPHSCAVDRRTDLGVCRTGIDPLVASAFAHQGEEACLVGRRGSGTIFFSRCNLHCVFCQNHDLSQRDDGEPCSPERIAALALDLQSWGCHNLNLVSPSHVVPQVVQALVLAAGRGLEIPVVYNTNAYDSLESLRLLEGLIDIYMPDFKFWEADTAQHYCGATDYPERARAALTEMQRQVGPLVLDADGRAARGLLVRHLVLPGLVDESRFILEWLAAEISRDTYVNIMGQYRPCYLVGAPAGNGTVRFGELNRRPTEQEMSTARAAARQAGLWRFA